MPALPLVLLAALATTPAVASKALEISELEFLIGNWTGHLEYLDYGDDKTKIRLPTSISCRLREKSLLLETTFDEPDGSKVTDKATIRPLGDGTKVAYGGAIHRVLTKQFDSAKQTYRLVLTSTGKDTSKPATIKTTILLEQDVLRISKQVTYQDSAVSLTRNEYKLNRGE